MWVAFYLFMVFWIWYKASQLYVYSSIFPQSIRRSWVQLMYPSDYTNWEEYQSILTNHFPFYKLLNEKEKSEFLVRLSDFKNRLPFEGREGLDLDQKKHILLCASLTQITYGLKDFRFYGFEKVIIYPEIFYSKFLNTQVKGITYATGFIYLSWKDFEEGYADSENKINLGLHEFAHALKIEKDNLFAGDDFEVYENMVGYLMKQKVEKNEENELFRDYGFTNINEFWAVSVEVYFEQPIEFRRIYPNMYRVICSILRQDMAKRMEANAHNEDTFQRGLMS